MAPSAPRAASPKRVCPDCKENRLVKQRRGPYPLLCRDCKTKHRREQKREAAEKKRKKQQAPLTYPAILGKDCWAAWISFVKSVGSCRGKPYTLDQRNIFEWGFSRKLIAVGCASDDIAGVEYLSFLDTGARGLLVQMEPSAVTFSLILYCEKEQDRAHFLILVTKGLLVFSCALNSFSISMMRFRAPEGVLPKKAAFKDQILFSEAMLTNLNYVTERAIGFSVKLLRVEELINIIYYQPTASDRVLYLVSSEEPLKDFRVALQPDDFERVDSKLIEGLKNLFARNRGTPQDDN